MRKRIWVYVDAIISIEHLNWKLETGINFQVHWVSPGQGHAKKKKFLHKYVYWFIQVFRNTNHNCVWQLFVSIVKFQSYFGDLVWENFVTIGPVSIPPNTFWNLTQAKTKKKCTSHKSKCIWASHCPTQYTSTTNPASQKIRNIETNTSMPCSRKSAKVFRNTMLNTVVIPKVAVIKKNVITCIYDLTTKEMLKILFCIIHSECSWLVKVGMAKQEWE